MCTPDTVDATEQKIWPTATAQDPITNTRPLHCGWDVTICKQP